MHSATTSLEETKTGNYFLAATITECIGDYEFTMNSYCPQNAIQTAAEKLSQAIKPQVLRTLAKQKSKMLVSHSQMPCETTAGRR